MEKFTHLLSKDNKFQILLFIGFNIILVFAETFGIALIPLFIDFAVSDNPILPNYFTWINQFIENKEKDTIIIYGSIFLILIFLIKNFLVFSIIAYQIYLNKKFNFDLKKKFFNLYVFAPFEIINSYNTSQILRNINEEITNYILNFFLILKTFKDILLFLAIFILLLFVDYFSTLIAVLILFTCLFVYFFTFYGLLKKLGENQLKSKNAIISWLMQGISSIKEIKISKKENNIVKKFLDKVLVFENSTVKINLIQSIPPSLFELLFVIITLSLIAFAVTTKIENILPILSLYVVSFIRLLPIFTRLGSTLSNLRRSYPSVLHLNSELIKLEKYMTHQKNDEKNLTDNLKFEKYLTFDDINFKYQNRDQNILENFDLKIEKGKVVALVGKSGSGKTTIINLICGFLSPSKGKIKADNQEIQNNLSSWQKKIGLVPQDNYLLDDTIKNNIIFLDDKNFVDEKRLQEAIYYSGLKDLISTGLKIDSKVGEGGAQLSGGQIQRIALARLLYKDPEILILDEFTNSLDPENEDFIVDKLVQLKNEKKKTIIIVSHKIKPLKICDEIILLENKNIKEKFSYESFYNKFSSLYE